MEKLKIFKNLGFLALLSFTFIVQSCRKESENNVVVYKDVKVQISFDKKIDTIKDIYIKARDKNTGSEFEMIPDDKGITTFTLQLGEYEFSSTYSFSKKKGKVTTYNGLTNKLIGSSWNEKTDLVILKMIKSQKIDKNQVIIKELYTGGNTGDDGKNYTFGRYMILNNNSKLDVDLKNLCIGSLLSNSYYMDDEINKGDTDPYWFKDTWTPIMMGYFYFPNTTILKPGKDLVVALDGGIDHTKTHSNSIDLSKPEYYVAYAPSVFNHPRYHPAPSASIPVSHYLDAVKFSMGNGWATTTSCPNYILFYPEQDPKTYGKDNSDLDYYMGYKDFPRKKIYASWVSDAIDAFLSGEINQIKRINPKVDNGYVYHIGKKGYTLYRNVDKKATEAIKENKGKIVYNYSMGTNLVEVKDGSTDPSKIDAEASIAKGARIIYMDTNNSSKDFHLRKKSSLRK